MIVSIRSRLLVSASIVLAAFLGLTGIALERGFHDSAETAVHGQLQAHIYTLLAAAELDNENTLYLPDELPEPRFSSPDSGLVAAVTGMGGKPLWKSKSMIGQELPELSAADTGQWQFATLENKLARKFIMASFVASWEGSNRKLYKFRFLVAEDFRVLHSQVLQFRQSLWRWLGAAGLILLAAQGTILRWSLAPLKQAEDEIASIEAGRINRLSKNYPKELDGLTHRLNLLIENSDKHLRRYRDSLGNLAHSLKTPLAVLRNALDSNAPPEDLRRTLNEQFNRMVEIIDHQLQRAATAGRSAIGSRHSVIDPINKIASALAKVYADKSVELLLVNKGDPQFSGDEGDFYELAGNLMDNAYKWCKHTVRVVIAPVDSGNGIDHLKLVVEDDGAGIPAHIRTEVIARGKRADQNSNGQGLGLDMVAETVKLYQGSMEISGSDLGGAKIAITI